MKQINLKAASQQPYLASKENPVSLVVGVIILFLAIGAYGALYYMNGKVKKQTKELQSQKTVRQAKLSNEEFKEMYLFQDRLNDLKARLQNRLSYSEYLDKIARYTLPETAYKSVSLVHKDKQVNVEVVLEVPNIDTLNKQLKAYTQQEGIFDFTPGSITESQVGEGGISNTVKFSFPTQSSEAAGEAPVVPAKTK